MNKQKFLTIYAVLDNATQDKLNTLQQYLLKNKLIGTQTKDIPYHITLGSFPITMQNELVEKINKHCLNLSTFSINLFDINHFKNKVLFIEPQLNEDLVNLHNSFKGNFADNYNWQPHITIYCGTRLKTIKAKKVIKKDFIPFKAQITSIQLSEFFPTKIIYTTQLQKK